MLCALIGNFRSRLVFSPVLTLEMMALRSSLTAYSVSLSALKTPADVLARIEHDLVDILGLMHLIGDHLKLPEEQDLKSHATLFGQ